MSHERRIYLLDPQKLPPETIAVTFAKTSRSPETFEQIASELSESKSAEFNEKWVVGYGHSSVAEHAVLHIAIENISRLAVETLESNRLASYTEKSTRYQTWEPDAFYSPQELEGSALQQTYQKTCLQLFQIYHDLLPILINYLQKSAPLMDSESTAARERRLRTQAIDNCRFLLPAASLANVGVTINARALEHAIGKLLSNPLSEVRKVGAEIKQAASNSVPTLLKYANEIPYLREVSEKFATIPVNELPENSDWCTLVDFPVDALDRVLAAALYHQSSIDYQSAVSIIRSLPGNKRAELIQKLIGGVEKHTIPARELENAFFTFDLLLDQGAYFEVKRHRMMTQIPQPLTIQNGYATPAIFRSAGVMETYQEALNLARQSYEILAKEDPQVAAYLVPNGFNRRVLLTTNLRSAIHFIKLRSASNAHFSVRRVAQRMAEEIIRVLPELKGYLSNEPGETSVSIEEEYFCSNC